MLVHSVGAAYVERPVLLAERPADLPVVGIHLVPAYHVAHALVVLALLGDALQRLADDEVDVVADEGEGVHGGHIHASVPAVAVVHHVADVIAEMACGIGHSGRHDACVVGFDLEIYVIGVGIVLPVADLGSCHSLPDVVARLLVGVPEHVSGLGERFLERAYRGVQTFLLEHVHEGQVHVDVVIQAGGVVEVPFDVAVRPFYRDVVVDHGSGIPEFRGASVGAAYGLSGPGALDLVHQDFLAHCHFGRDAALSGASCGNADRAQGAKYHQSSFHCLVLLLVFMNSITSS